MKYLTLLLIALFSSSLLIAQKVENVSSSQVGNNIKVTYQISGSTPNQLLTVNLYYSINDGTFIGPLQKVSGDVGDNVSGNGIKTIDWNVLSEISALDGNVKFKIDILPKQNIQMPVANGQDMKVAIESCVLENNSLAINCILESAIDREWIFNNENTFLFDEFGAKIISTTVKWGSKTNKYASIYLMKNVPFRISFIFDDINVNMRIIKALEFGYSTMTSFSNNKIQFRDLPIIKK